MTTDRERDIRTIEAQFENRRLVRKWYLGKLGNREPQGTILEAMLNVRDREENDGNSYRS